MDLEKQLEVMFIKFDRACDMLERLDAEIEVIRPRFLRAKRDNRRSFRYNLHIRVSTLEGVRNAYYEYACQAKLIIEETQRKLGMIVAFENDS